jgi:hypothetical protein
MVIDATFNKEWLSDICLALNEQFSAYVMARTSKIRQDEGDVFFVLDQHAELDLDSASSLKHAASRHITPLGHIMSHKINRNTIWYPMLTGPCSL